MENDKPSSPPTPREQLEVGADGVYLLRTQSDQARLGRMFWDNGVVSRRNFQTPLQVQVGIQAVKALGLQPAVALRQTGFVNGSFTVWGDVPLAIVQKSGQLESKREFCYVIHEVRVKLDDAIKEEQVAELLLKGARREGHYLIYSETRERTFANNNLHLPPDGAVCVMKRRGEEFPVEYSFSKEDAERAGLWGKAGPWTQYPQIMLMRRARAVCIQKGFSDITNCVAQADNDIEGVPEHFADQRHREKLIRDQRPQEPLTPERARALGYTFGPGIAPPEKAEKIIEADDEMREKDAPDA